jgi:hypothetical protein
MHRQTVLTFETRKQHRMELLNVVSTHNACCREVHPSCLCATARIPVLLCCYIPRTCTALLLYPTHLYCSAAPLRRYRSRRNMRGSVSRGATCGTTQQQACFNRSSTTQQLVPSSFQDQSRWLFCIKVPTPPSVDFAHSMFSPLSATNWPCHTYHQWLSLVQLQQLGQLLHHQHSHLLLGIVISSSTLCCCCCCPAAPQATQAASCCACTTPKDVPAGRTQGQHGV